MEMAKFNQAHPTVSSGKSNLHFTIFPQTHFVQKPKVILYCDKNEKILKIIPSFWNSAIFSVNENIWLKCSTVLEKTFSRKSSCFLWIQNAKLLSRFSRYRNMLIVYKIILKTTPQVPLMFTTCRVHLRSVKNFTWTLFFQFSSRTGVHLASSNWMSFPSKTHELFWKLNLNYLSRYLWFFIFISKLIESQRYLLKFFFNWKKNWLCSGVKTNLNLIFFTRVYR